MECSMMKWIAAAGFVVTLLIVGLFASSAVAPPALAASAVVQKGPALQATDIGARRRYRHRHLYTYHPYYPYYYGHPYYYSPGPFLLPWFDAWNSW
jgi:hypothetical protein